ncbi:MAG: phosphodiester glycosidase family protein [Clostridia bacterium]|nr:phosphodiester glycosidase family protein [Clostridia bacterium]
MKKPVRVLLIALVALMILALPFVLPSANMLEDYQYGVWTEWAWTEGLLSVARAEEAELAPLPIDFSSGMAPNPAAFTGEGYEDDSISIRLEHIVDEANNLSWRVAYITIKDPSQLRTGIAGKKVTANNEAKISDLLRTRYPNAIIAINGDCFSKQSNAGYVYRMGEKRIASTNKQKDILIIDENADFHIFLQNDNKNTQKSEIEAFLSEGHTIVNAFTFGPALVKEGNLLQTPTDYKYDPNSRDQRAAIGQMGELSYVFVLCEARWTNYAGATHQELANFMYDLGCLEAYNLDGGNSAVILYGDGYFQTKRTYDNERELSDFIYFATLVDPADWSE